MEINRSLLIEEKHTALFPYKVTSTQKFMVTQQFKGVHSSK